MTLYLSLNVTKLLMSYVKMNVLKTLRSEFKKLVNYKY